ncbi:2OG-Fe(II) oxygenase [Luteimonas arsenica]|uniref:2OG-Fe(II) oxygenase n=1 Tax=Luteimonas arsenica TaxID=1586242 RepID=UPI001055CD65|nr:2OG-Fe(II) oxygenase [Luteimonas arsenica]
MAIKLSTQVAAWLHSQVVAGAGFEQIQPVLSRQGFNEVEVRQIYNAVLRDPDGFKAGFSRVTAGQPQVAHRLSGSLLEAATDEAGAGATTGQPPFLPSAAIPVDIGHGIACDHGEARIAFRCERPHVVLFENVLTHEECDALVAEAVPRLRRAAVVDSEHGGDVIDERRTSELVHMPRGGSPLLSRIDARIARITGVPVERGEPLQVMRYGVGAQYKPHFDYFQLDRPGQAGHLARGGQRVSSLVVYLNDVEAGGETTFPRSGLSVAPRKGSAVYFAYTDAQSRVDPLSFHAGAPVLRGEKWIATRWMREREFV